LFVGAMLLVVCVNAGLVYFAVREPVGIVAASPYEKGLHFNSELAQRSRQDALGWQVSAGYFPNAAGKTSANISGSNGQIVVELRDRAGKPLRGLAGQIRLVRPVEVLAPVDAILVEGNEGRYTATVALPRHGQWDVTIDIGDQFSAVHRIVVP
jgi:nitrogen fixation protein FixH